MFGAILLIAILVALMAQTTEVVTTSDQASAEMIKRKIATAEADLAETRRLASALATPAENSGEALLEEKQQLELAVAAARAQRDQIGAEIRDQVAEQTVDFSSEWKKLAAGLQAIQAKQEEAVNAIKAQLQNTARLNGRVADIEKIIQKEKSSRIVTLRFPRERAKTKGAWPVICKFGKMYSLTNTGGGRNETTIAWKERRPGSKLSKPIESLGWTIADHREAINQLLLSIPKGEAYVAFYVYPDSFEVFHWLRDQAISQRLEFGVELEPAGVELSWGSDGTSPPPL
jgi:hypothetical protein